MCISNLGLQECMTKPQELATNVRVTSPVSFNFNGCSRLRPGEVITMPASEGYIYPSQARKDPCFSQGKVPAHYSVEALLYTQFFPSDFSCSDLESSPSNSQWVGNFDFSSCLHKGIQGTCALLSQKSVFWVSRKTLSYSSSTCR